jgi:multisubunit Na+/H+ antiporter MnhG subunit
MRARDSIRDFRNIGILVAAAWTGSAVISLIASLCVYCDFIPDATDEQGHLLVLAAALGLGNAIGAHAITRALVDIAIAAACEISIEHTRRTYLS